MPFNLLCFSIIACPLYVILLSIGMSQGDLFGGFFFCAHSFSCFALFFKYFFSYASSFYMIHNIHIFGLYGVGHLSCKCLAWALFKLPLWFALLVNCCNHVIDIKILGVFFCSNYFFHPFYKRLWVMLSDMLICSQI